MVLSSIEHQVQWELHQIHLRTFKNKRMPGHMGSVNTTVINLEVVKVIAEKNLILIKGGIPGPNKGRVVIKDSVKA